MYHFPNFIRPPLTRGKSVVTIHDVSFLRHPETTERKILAYMTGQIHQTARQADAIITDSYFSGREIEELLGVSPDRIFPIHLGLPEPRALPDRDAAGMELEALGLDRPFLLFVSTLEPRKNIPFLVELFEHMTEFDGDLVIAGMKGWKYEPILERIRTSRRAEHIRYLDYVSDRQLGALYRKASLFVFPSIYEGFGFPPLEAMQAGCPVLSSPAGSLAEVLGDAASLVEGYDAAEWADRAQSLIGDHSKRDRLIQQGLEQVTRFDWRETAKSTWDVYRSL